MVLPLFSMIGACCHLLTFFAAVLTTQGNLEKGSVLPIADKGFGVICNGVIRKGECIIRETPIVVIKKGVDDNERLIEKVEDLLDYERSQFDGLHSCSKYDDEYGVPTIVGIFNTNALPLGKGSPFAGVFPNIARFNHDCSPNAHYSYDDEKACATLYAVKEIDEGEEIVISYINPLQSRADRLQYLEEHFGFICRCKRCAETDTESAEISDNRREEIAELTHDTRKLMMKSIGNNDVDKDDDSSSEEVIKLVQRRLKLLEEEGLDQPELMLPCAFDAYQTSKDKEWLELARQWAAESEGDDSDNVTYFDEMLAIHDQIYSSSSNEKLSKNSRHKP
jgi:hypothetical protein